MSILPTKEKKPTFSNSLLTVDDIRGKKPSLAVGYLSVMLTQNECVYDLCTKLEYSMSPISDTRL